MDAVISSIVCKKIVSSSTEVFGEIKVDQAWRQRHSRRVKESNWAMGGLELGVQGSRGFVMDSLVCLQVAIAKHEHEMMRKGHHSLGGV